MVADRIGYPLILRASFTLGGAGSGVAYNREEMEEIAKAGVMAGAEFNNASAMPMSSYTVDLVKLKSVSG